MLNVEGYNINLSYDKEFREEYKTIKKVKVKDIDFYNIKRN